MPFAFTRTDRLNEEVRREVDRIIREDVHDPRVTGTYSVTHAEVTRDLRYAKVYVSVLEQNLADPLLTALKGAAGFIRRCLGKRVQLHYTPELLFERDTNIAYGARMTSLIDAVIAKEKDAHHEDP
ncbi:MAG: 30S ribosome-binding factor RbfA [Oscillospiraceae bacterium]|jgi:ribosome-binding factor A|nr:30S ribosome-binding factor RbfA [Oscillospiraceae bacterium]